MAIGWNPAGAWQSAKEIAEKLDKLNKSLGMSPRQQVLNRLLAYYQTCQYDTRKFDWDGAQHADDLEHEVIASAGYIPPGFVDVGGASLPIKFRRPFAPYNLVRIVVDRFTGQLFADGKNPRFEAWGDEELEDYLNTLADSSRLWSFMAYVRSMGGAMGSVCVGFQFRDGEVVWEYHDPRWTQPYFNPVNGDLVAIDKRWIVPVESVNADGHVEIVPHWSRRVIDTEADTLYSLVPAEGDPPEWEKIPHARVEHGFGFVPAVWVQNLPEMGDVDGSPDCLGGYDMAERLDYILSQTERALLYNADPTLSIVTDESLGAVATGSDNALKLPIGSTAQYLEISGQGIEKLKDLAEMYRRLFLEQVACVIDELPQGGESRTATEVNKSQNAMTQKVGRLQEQYGHRCLRPLMELVYKAAVKLAEPDDEGEIQEIYLPPKKVETGKGESRLVKFVERKLPERKKKVRLQVVWPATNEPTTAEIAQATQAVAQARTAGLLDLESSVNYLAPLFNIKDVQAVLDALEKEKAESQAAMGSSMFGPGMAGMQPPGMGGEPELGMEEELPPGENPEGEETEGEEIDLGDYLPE